MGFQHNTSIRMAFHDIQFNDPNAAWLFYIFGYVRLSNGQEIAVEDGIKIELEPNRVTNMVRVFGPIKERWSA